MDFATAAWFALVSPAAFQLQAGRSPDALLDLISEFYLAGISAREPGSNLHRS